MATEPAAVIARLIEYVQAGDPARAEQRLTHAASEAAHLGQLTHGARTRAVLALTLAGELVGIGRRHAETILRAAFDGVGR